jgi:hypothetical protein
VIEGAEEDQGRTWEDSVIEGVEEDQGRTWEDCVIDVARRKGKTFVELKRLARDRIAFRKWTEDPTLQGDRDEEEEEEERL